MSHLHASNLFSVQGQVAVITGGGSGLGRTMAHTLSANGASKIFIIGRRLESLQETAAQAETKDTIIPVQADITSKESLEAAYQTIAAQTSHVDLLIANSGIVGALARPPPSKPDGTRPSLSEIRDALWSIPPEDFTKTFDVNVTGSYYTVLAFLPLLEAANKRRAAPQKNVLSSPTAQVIITSSIAGFNRLVPFSIAYNTSKAAVNHLVKVLATLLTPYDVRVNGIAPGLYLSEMSAPNFKGDGDKGISDGSFGRDIIPLSRAGGEEDIGGLVLYMAGAAGGYLNGNITVTDGGRLSAIPATY
ncbi:short chain dehydrogenase/reductase family [Aspergillus steynii IBT 23096]|uniref:Short chain dehydrogenase/reductase family n=1 Tax=Aspergillus steynii IBT 23096 TaxID=1392250 RepID=A0A2I2FUU7_9EURO|nr:short chain dehydrogenase/reductase family [Aspergillus steynii IBT 23096]PLB44381.1 short chain dehydrogenase/reductase family [Aspergillus steynii IBT 23096]